MVGFGGIVVSRRGMLRGALFAGAFAASATSSPTPVPSETASPAPTTPTLTPPTLTPSEWVTVKSFDEGWTTEIVSSFPQLVTVDSSRDAFDCRVLWDSRLFVVSPVVLAVTDSAHVVDFESVGAGELLLHVPAAATVLLFDVRALNLYPNENIGAAANTVFEVRGPEAVLTAVAAPQSVVECAPWALEVEADWTTVGGVMAPVSVRLISCGPHPVPANTVVDTITAAPAQQAEVVTTSGVALRTENAVNHLTVHLQVVQGLPAATTETVSFPFGEPDSTPRANPAVISSVVHHLPPDTTGMRITGKNSAYPVTDSGIPVSSFELSPTA